MKRTTMKRQTVVPRKQTGRRRSTEAARLLGINPAAAAQNLETPPKWVNETPTMHHGYTLEMWNEYDGAMQSLEISREEYIALKEHLAHLRGFEVTGRFEVAEFEVAAGRAH
jgi:hypothetical protein